MDVQSGGATLDELIAEIARLDRNMAGQSQFEEHQLQRQESVQSGETSLINEKTQICRLHSDLSDCIFTGDPRGL